MKEAPPIENPLGPHNDLVIVDIKRYEDGKKKEDGAEPKEEVVHIV